MIYSVNKLMTKTFFAFDTANSISVSVEFSNILDRIKSKIMSLHDTFNVFSESSEISKINRSAGKEYVTVSSDTYEVIKKSIRFAEETDGIFDISAFPVTQAWKCAEKLPTEESIRKKLSLVNYRNILLKDGYVKLLYPCMGIDLGGIAKGYAADVAVKMLNREGIHDALINFGGTVITLGKERSVGICNPFDPKNKTIGSITAKNKAIVTSGSYERYSVLEGKQYHHIIDPRTGFPVETNLISVTLIGNSACELDALCTGIFILGMDKGVKLLANKDTDAIFITKNGDVLLTNGIRNSFTLRRDEP